VRAVDIDPGTAAAFAAEHGLALSASLDEALGDPDL
jgi:predicted dehydrogenase